MAKFLQLAVWNAKGLTQHIEKLKAFITLHNIDVMLTSETHFTEKKLSKASNIHSLPYKPSSWNCSKRNCYDNKNPASTIN
jgi:exonuclease III